MSSLFKRLYDSMSQERWHRLFGHVKCEQMARHIRYFPIHDNVLEIGTAEGYLLRYLKKHNVIKRGTGYDISLSRIKKARQAVAGTELAETLTFCVGDGTLLPFSDREFDVVVLPHVLEHVPRMTQIATILKEVTRVSRYGGCIVLPIRDSKERFGRYSKYVDLEHLKNLIQHQNHWIYHSDSFEDFLSLLGYPFRRSHLCDRYYFLPREYPESIPDERRCRTTCGPTELTLE